MPKMINITCHPEDGYLLGLYFEHKVRAYKVFEVFGEQFFVHRRVRFISLSNQWQVVKEWTVSHVDTGFRIGVGDLANVHLAEHEVTCYLKYKGEEELKKYVNLAKGRLAEMKKVEAPEVFNFGW